MRPTTQLTTTFHTNQLDFTKAVGVISGPQKFVMPVENFHEGDEVVIADQVSREQAAQIHAWLNPRVPLKGIKELLEYSSYLQDTHGITRPSRSNRETVLQKMAPADPALRFVDKGQVFGFMRLRADDWRALYFAGAATLVKKAGEQSYPNGFVAVHSPDGQSIFGIQPDTFLKTYRLADGTVIANLATQVSVLTAEGDVFHPDDWMQG